MLSPAAGAMPAPSLHERLRADFDTEPVPQPSALDAQIGGDHYKNFAIQPVTFIEANKLPFLEGCVIKRLCRHTVNGSSRDIRKSIHELTLLLELRYGEKL